MDDVSCLSFFLVQCQIKAVQLVGNLKREKIEKNIEIRDAIGYLAGDLA